MCALEAWEGGALTQLFATCQCRTPAPGPEITALGCWRPGTRLSPQRPLVVTCRGALICEEVAGYCVILSTLGGVSLCGGETLLDVGKRGQGTKSALDTPAQKGFREPCRPPSSSRGWAEQTQQGASGRSQTSHQGPNRCSNPGEAHPDPPIPLGESLPRLERIFKQGTPVAAVRAIPRVAARGGWLFPVSATGHLGGGGALLPYLTSAL